MENEARETQVAKELLRQHEILTELEHGIELLDTRLTKVLVENTVSDEEINSKITIELVPLAKELVQNNNKIVEIIERLNNLRQRLEL